MGIFSWVFLGLIARAFAKFIMPGKDPGGIIVTILIGIAGAIVGGFLGSFVGLGKVESFDLGGIFIATIGAIILLIIYRLLIFGQNLGESPCEISKTQGAVLSVGKFPGEIQMQMGLGIIARMSLGSGALSGCGIDRRKPHAFGAVTNDRS